MAIRRLFFCAAFGGTSRTIVRIRMTRFAGLIFTIGKVPTVRQRRFSFPRVYFLWTATSIGATATTCVKWFVRPLHPLVSDRTERRPNNRNNRSCRSEGESREGRPTDYRIIRIMERMRTATTCLSAEILPNPLLTGPQPKPHGAGAGRPWAKGTSPRPTPPREGCKHPHGRWLPTKACNQLRNLLCQRNRCRSCSV